MTDLRNLRIERVDATEPLLEDWRHVHNVIVPPAAMDLDEVRERAGRNHLEVAYLGDVLVGCTTVRPPTDDTATATVIARVLPAHRHQGLGEQLYVRALAQARELGARRIETVVLAANTEGLRFAERHGFVEFDRYTLPGESALWIDLRLA
ncbi:GNAT family N-acetyltransferase [Streptomyces sp. ActVer]|uniref:GNAT family N-acetyltransferase n=1 Tax=Streptomyces sp. ActVer TaxID=3014558 RepID=UPI0022B360D6|nr:GNAT family N-acetyltransferase [Streptomyces sp. ActVer]MCZ4510408.1 GNAT family N-acetyltransferase [Streptomyces sp. ActVer]